MTEEPEDVDYRELKPGEVVDLDNGTAIGQLPEGFTLQDIPGVKRVVTKEIGESNEDFAKRAATAAQHVFGEGLKLVAK